MDQDGLANIVKCGPENFHVDASQFRSAPD